MNAVSTGVSRLKESETGGPAITFEAVSKSFGAMRALQDVSFTVPQGQTLALLGPNGAGKTTAISLMLGLRAPSSGKVTLLGLDPSDPRARSRCGVMLQESGVPLNLTVRELIALFRSYYPSPMTVAQAQAMAGLEDKANTRAGALSGGQRQRLYFALAICGAPAVLFLDEPTAALDVESRRAFWEHMRAFAQQGKTIVLTTHYLEEADALADRVIVVERGRLVADASPAALKARVAQKRVSFDLAQPLEESVFSGLPLQSLELNHLRATLLTAEPEATLRGLFARGAQLRNLEVVGAGLEDAVLMLTGKQDGRD